MFEQGMSMRRRENLFFAGGLLFLAGLNLAFGSDAGGRADKVLEQNGMVLIARRTVTIGSTYNERIQLAQKYACDPTWLNDDLIKQTHELGAFWIDKCPVTNAQYLAFVRQTGARPPWPGGIFPRDRADHPVADVTYTEAEKYAAWAGKRLPTAIEWQAALEAAGLYPWGDGWPGPVEIKERGLSSEPSWPPTDPVGTGRHGVAPTGMEDTATQVCEWTSTSIAKVVPHYLVKGTCWLHRDPVNFRANSGSYIPGVWASPMIGFRCAVDGDKAPASIARALPAEPAVPAPPSPPAQSPARTDAGRISLIRLSQDLLGFQIKVPDLGEVSFYAPETVRINDVIVHSFINRPHIEWGAAGTDLIEYDIRAGLVELKFRMEAKGDYVDQACTIHNGWIEPIKFSVSSCMRLEKLGSIYDLEAQRTYLLNSIGEYIPLRQIPRKGECIRWVAECGMDNLGGLKDRALIATESIDKRFAVGCGRADAGSTFIIQENTWFHCFHVEPVLQLAANETRVIRQRMYFIKGGLAELKSRFEQDIKAQRE